MKSITTTKISFTSKCIVHKKTFKNTRALSILILYCQFNIYAVRNKSFYLKDMKEFILEANINYELTLPHNPDSVTGNTMHQEKQVYKIFIVIDQVNSQIKHF